MSTLNEIFNSDMKEWGVRHRKYWSSSNLSVREKRMNQPKQKKSPRDRVLKRLLNLSIKKAMADITATN